MSQQEPTLPHDALPAEMPGNEASVQAEVDGTSRLSVYSNVEMLDQAHRLKSTGIRFQLPAWIAPGNVVIRLIPLTHGAMQTFQAAQRRIIAAKVQKGKSQNDRLPTWAGLELNNRVLRRSVAAWCEGSVDIEGIRRATQIRGEGIRFAFPRDFLPGVVFRLRSLSHPYIQAVRAEREQKLREKFNVGQDGALPAEFEIELQRSTFLASILSWEEGTVEYEGDPNFTLKGQPRSAVRAWVAKVFLPEPNLNRKAPSDAAKKEEFYLDLFGGYNMDFVNQLVRAHAAIRKLTPEQILTRGADTTVGDDSGYDAVSTYVPGALADWTGASREELREHLLAFLPSISLDSHPPDDRDKKEAWYEDTFRFYNNDFANELYEAHNLMDRIDVAELLEKKDDFTLGASEDLD